MTDTLIMPTTEIYNFVRPYFKEYTDQDVISVIDRHWIYGTIDAVYRNGKIVAVCRWNISPDGKVCDVIDMVIRPGEKGTRLIRHMVARNWHRFPTVRYIKFRRGIKYPYRNHRIYRVRDILKLRRVKHGR